jgi:hypothetical protein
VSVSADGSQAHFLTSGGPSTIRRKPGVTHSVAGAYEDVVALQRGGRGIGVLIPGSCRPSISVKRWVTVRWQRHF